MRSVPEKKNLQAEADQKYPEGSPGYMKRDAERMHLYPYLASQELLVPDHISKSYHSLHWVVWFVVLVTIFVLESRAIFLPRVEAGCDCGFSSLCPQLTCCHSLAGVHGSYLFHKEASFPNKPDVEETYQKASKEIGKRRLGSSNSWFSKEITLVPVYLWILCEGSSGKVAKMCWDLIKAAGGLRTALPKYTGIIGEIIVTSACNLLHASIVIWVNKFAV